MMSDNDKIVPTVSRAYSDGTLVELLYRADAHQTAFAIWREGAVTISSEFSLNKGERLVPFSPENNLIKNNAVLLPSEPLPYESEDALIDGIRAFIHRYVDLTPTFEQIATYYVLLTWIFDAFNDLPYLRFRGDFGTGKTRALLTIGSLCYKPFFASGASTVSPIFHTLDAFRGTLIFDEADFRFSDERAEIVKILNNGNARGMPVLRTMQNHQREFNPRAFQVFGPKVIASRSSYDDRALESRFITAHTGTHPLRSDVPIALKHMFYEEAGHLRNQLLTFRFKRLAHSSIDEALRDFQLEPRFNQVLLPLLSLISDLALRQELLTVMREAQAGLVAESGLLPEAHVLAILAELTESTDASVVPLAAIADTLRGRFASEYDRRITNRWIGQLLRKKLNIRTYKSHGVYVVPMTERGKIELLCTRFGINLHTATKGTLN